MATVKHAPAPRRGANDRHEQAGGPLVRARTSLQCLASGVSLDLRSVVVICAVSARHVPVPNTAGHEICCTTRLPCAAQHAVSNARARCHPLMDATSHGAAVLAMPGAHHAAKQPAPTHGGEAAGKCCSRWRGK